MARLRYLEPVPSRRLESPAPRRASTVFGITPGIASAVTRLGKSGIQLAEDAMEAVIPFTLIPRLPGGGNLRPGETLTTDADTKTAQICFN